MPIREVRTINLYLPRKKIHVVVLDKQTVCFLSPVMVYDINKYFKVHILDILKCFWYNLSLAADSICSVDSTVLVF